MLEGIAGTAPPSSPAQAASRQDESGRVRDAARQFEALLVGQLLKGMRDSEGGWLGSGEDQSCSSAMEYAQEIFAQSLSAAGGLGVARIVVDGLAAPGKS
jgi:Rod binding domain-containing protein